MKAPPDDRRVSSRIAQAQTIRIRPAESEYPEEIRSTLNVSWDGLYFATSLDHYFVDMILHITRNYLYNDPNNLEEAGTVVRVDKLKERRWGVAVHFSDRENLAHPNGWHR